jgi:uncharacterized paraquat-inducible protein A
MALVPCKECGTLNSSEAEICLSCEYPIRGRAKTNWWKWVALILAVSFGLPVLLYAIDIAKNSPQPQPSQVKDR